MVKVNKIGSYHLENNLNNQDFIYVDEKRKVKLVLDGCGQGKSSEIGVKLFVQLFIKYLNEKYDLTKIEASAESAINTPDEIIEIFKLCFNDIINITKIVNPTNTLEVLVNNFLFTILCVLETDEEFIAITCGDGFIITQDKLDKIGFINLESNNEFEKEAPKYYMYNYIDSEYLELYKQGVEFEITMFPKSKYKNIGIASDGLRFLLEQDYDILERFKILLVKSKSGAINRMIIGMNEGFTKIKEKSFIRTSRVLKDDITICF